MASPAGRRPRRAVFRRSRPCRQSTAPSGRTRLGGIPGSYPLLHARAYPQRNQSPQKTRNPNGLRVFFRLVTPPGLEPGTREPKSLVLPITPRGSVTRPRRPLAWRKHNPPPLYRAPSRGQASLWVPGMPPPPQRRYARGADPPARFPPVESPVQHSKSCTRELILCYTGGGLRPAFSANATGGTTSTNAA